MTLAADLKQLHVTYMRCPAAVLLVGPEKPFDKSMSFAIIGDVLDARLVAR
jgi:hypothetical protein